MLSQYTLCVPHHRLYLFSWLRQSVPYSLLLWLFFLGVTSAFAQEPSRNLVPTSPLLILNTDMHTSDIKRIDTDAEGQYILTVSTDKTAKLWDAQTGELLHTFRIPIAQGNEGMLYAGAISPDGETLSPWRAGQVTHGMTLTVSTFSMRSRAPCSNALQNCPMLSMT
jgi:WD40 repeat protein